MTKIHETAIVSSKAKISENVEIGAYCVIGDNVEIDSGSVIKSHVVIEKNTKIGKNNLIYPFAVIGVASQDLKYAGEETFVEIGDNNTIREHVTIHLGTVQGGGVTRLGNNCLLMVGVHLAHDCIVGNHVIMANGVTLAGHVEVENHVVIGGLSAVHQFVRIGQSAMIGGMSGVESDVIPFVTVMGNRAKIAGLNLLGMKRRGVERLEIHAMRGFFKKIYEEKSDEVFSSRVKNNAAEFDCKIVREVLQFVENGGDRGFCHFE
jgi:UDP-N-acetylglucosamine acyltransferase